MFKNRYWREYPLFLQSVLLLLMIFSFTSFFFAIAQLAIPKITGVSLLSLQDLNENSPKKVINAALLLQLITASGIFLLPALLFSYMTHPRPTEYLGLRKPGKPIQWLLVPLVILGAMVIFLFINAIFQQMMHGLGFQDMQEKHDNMVKAFLNMTSPADLVKALSVMAILPAICEEMIFRGILMRLIHKRSHRTGIAIAISSLVFAIVHYDPAGLVAIFCAGALLGGIYYLTGSLWLGILAHLINNGLQIVLIYIGNHNQSLKTIMDSNELPLPVVITGVALFIVSFYLLWKSRTPLPANWSDDFAGEEREDNFTQI
ncbi:MAG: CPBP family intramembrane metalloprotease [Sphingobacteriales bacterium]|nr:MAG: CPBP family intramembrane metalloprotease [Sphingobacteriales bacterium]